MGPRARWWPRTAARCRATRSSPARRSCSRAACCCCVLAAAAGELAPAAWEDASARSAGAAVFLLAFDSLAGFLLYTSLLRDTPIGLVGTYAYVVPLIAVALGVVALGDHVSAGAALGAAVAMAAVTAQLRAVPATARR